jgi:Protein of unknown function (DUF2975)
MSNVGDRSIQRAASRLRFGVFAAMILIVLAYLAAAFDLHLANVHVEHRSHEIAAAYAELIGAGSLALLLVALFELSRMLGRIAAGELFSNSVIRRFRGFALWLLVMALFELVAPIVAGIAGATATYPHQVRMTLDLRDLLTLGITLLLFLLASLLERARGLDEEMREFV